MTEDQIDIFYELEIAVGKADELRSIAQQRLTLSARSRYDRKPHLYSLNPDFSRTHSNKALDINCL